MFNFKSLTFIFFILLLVMNVLSFMGISIHFLFYISLISGYIAISVTASFFICSGFHMKALCRRETAQKVVAITFDDGPDPVNTNALLDILRNRAKATFFFIGNKIDGNEDLLKRMSDEGHLVGTHSFSHSAWFDFFSPRKMKKELSRSEDLLYKVLGKRPLFFRPPYGVINPMLKKALGSFSYHIIGFSNRAFDTVIKDEDRIIRRLTRNLRPGDVVLLHETFPNAPAVLNRFLDILGEREYSVVGLDELFNIKAYGE